MGIAALQNAHRWVTHPPILGAALSVIVVSLVGTAAIAAFLPSWPSEKVETSVQNTLSAASQRALRESLCVSCGTMVSVRRVETRVNQAEFGAVAGGLTGAAVGAEGDTGNGDSAMTMLRAAGDALLGNETEKNAKIHVTYRVTVRMVNGSFRVISQSMPPAVSLGGPVRILDGAVVARS